eukprot:6196484-Pleurochrysis_carterae.AAC.2
MANTAHWSADSGQCAHSCKALLFKKAAPRSNLSHQVTTRRSNSKPVCREQWPVKPPWQWHCCHHQP